MQQLSILRGWHVSPEPVRSNCGAAPIQHLCLGSPRFPADNDLARWDGPDSKTKIPNPDAYKALGAYHQDINPYGKVYRPHAKCRRWRATSFGGARLCQVTAGNKMLRCVRLLLIPHGTR